MYDLKEIVKEHNRLGKHDLRYAIKVVEGNGDDLTDLHKDVVCNSSGKHKPKTIKVYWIYKAQWYSIAVGTGKTYLAMAI